MDYLQFDCVEGTDGVSTLEAMASTAVGQHAAVRAEVDAVLAWARQHFPHTHGPVEEGQDWDEDLQVQHERDGWITVTLTLSASEAFVGAFLAVFGGSGD